MRFWISWWQPTADYRPLRDPPNAAILGWWETGQRWAGAEHSIVALVSAPHEADAHAAVKLDWPEATGWRFCEARSESWRPGHRFPFDEWMRACIDGGSPVGGAA